LPTVNREALSGKGCRSAHSKEENRTVKSKVVLVAGIAALGVAAYVGSRLGAQTPAAVQAPAQTRIAFVNTVFLIKNYHKFKTFDAELQELAKPYEKRDKELRDNMKLWQDTVKKPDCPQAQRDQGEQEIKKRQREIEDNREAAKKVLAKRNDEQIVQLYREIEDTVKRYAGQNGYHVVLQFDERTNPAEIYSPVNIQRKLQGSAGTGCCVPVHMAPGLDITQPVLAILNPAGAAPAPATTGGGAAAPAGH
jgi:Skp family chaperone for outer membrane proteins